MQSLNLHAYIWYKLLNSLFFGLSVGSIFVVYTPLQPSVFSLGGIFLAIGLLVVAKYYDTLMRLKIFFFITLFIEIIVLAFVLFFLIFQYNYMSALVVYLGYQVTFIFGSYLVRMETLILKKHTLLSMVDVAKQKGYLVGLILSYGFYKLLEYFGVTSKQTQVYDLHIGLLLLQLVIIWFIFCAFKKV